MGREYLSPTKRAYTGASAAVAALTRSHVSARRPRRHYAGTNSDRWVGRGGRRQVWHHRAQQGESRTPAPLWTAMRNGKNLQQYTCVGSAPGTDEPMLREHRPPRWTWRCFRRVARICSSVRQISLNSAEFSAVLPIRQSLVFAVSHPLSRLDQHSNAPVDSPAPRWLSPRQHRSPAAGPMNGCVQTRGRYTAVWDVWSSTARPFQRCGWTRRWTQIGGVPKHLWERGTRASVLYYCSLSGARS